MGYTVRELQTRMDSHEFAEWMAYYRIDPYGSWREDYRAGIVASTLANVNRTKDAKVFTPQDFIPEFDHAEEREEQSPEEQLQIVELLNASLGGRDLRQP